MNMLCLRWCSMTLLCVLALHSPTFRICSSQWKEEPCIPRTLEAWWRRCSLPNKFYQKSVSQPGGEAGPVLHSTSPSWVEFVLGSTPVASQTHQKSPLQGPLCPVLIVKSSNCQPNFLQAFMLLLRKSYQHPKTDSRWSDKCRWSPEAVPDCIWQHGSLLQNLDGRNERSCWEGQGWCVVEHWRHLLRSSGIFRHRVEKIHVLPSSSWISCQVPECYHPVRQDCGSTADRHQPVSFLGWCILDKEVCGSPRWWSIRELPACHVAREWHVLRGFSDRGTFLPNCWCYFLCWSCFCWFRLPRVLVMLLLILLLLFWLLLVLILFLSLLLLLLQQQKRLEQLQK